MDSPHLSQAVYRQIITQLAVAQLGQRKGLRLGQRKQQPIPGIVVNQHHCKQVH